MDDLLEFRTRRSSLFFLSLCQTIERLVGKHSVGEITDIVYRPSDGTGNFCLVRDGLLVWKKFKLMTKHGNPYVQCLGMTRRIYWLHSTSKEYCR